MVSRELAGIMLVAALGVTWAGCEREATSTAPPPSETFDTVPLPEDKPDYAFADGLDEQHPEIVAFMRQFLETCLAGDYSGYRRLVTRTADPESRARFEKVLHTLRTLKVESIDAVNLPEIDEAAYLVTCFATFRDPKKPSRPGQLSERNVAILVLREEGHWRMGIAPPELQPADDEPAPEKPPTTSAPSYPWDEGIDY